MTKYLKVMFDNKGADYKYKINEVNEATIWNPSSSDPKEMGGFNFSTEDKILRWLIRGDTLYDVEVPNDATIINCKSEAAPNGVFKSNKIIVKNPRKITDEMALDFYFKSNLPELSYYKSLAGCAIRGYEKTCLKIIEDKVNKNNIDVVLKEINDFVTPYNSTGTASNGIIIYEKVMKILKNIENDKYNKM